MDRIVHGVAKSWTQLSNFHFHERCMPKKHMKGYLTVLVIQEMQIKTLLMAQWIGIQLPMQRTWVRSLVQEDPTWLRAKKPTCHN